MLASSQTASLLLERWIRLLCMAVCFLITERERMSLLQLWIKTAGFPSNEMNFGHGLSHPEPEAVKCCVLIGSGLHWVLIHEPITVAGSEWINPTPSSCLEGGGVYAIEATTESLQQVPNKYCYCSY